MFFHRAFGRFSAVMWNQRCYWRILCTTWSTCIGMISINHSVFDVHITYDWLLFIFVPYRLIFWCVQFVKHQYTRRLYKKRHRFIGVYDRRTPKLLILDHQLVNDIYVKYFNNFSYNDSSNNVNISLTQLETHLHSCKRRSDDYWWFDFIFSLTQSWIQYSVRICLQHAVPNGNIRERFCHQR